MHSPRSRGLLTPLVVLFCTASLPQLWADGALVPLGDPDEGSAEPIRVAARRAVIIRPNHREELLLLQPLYHGPVREFCWLIPTPVAPEPRDVFPASQEFMDAIFRRTAPLVETELADATAWQPFLRPAPKDSPRLVQSLGERDVGPGERLDVRWYELAVLPQGKGLNDVSDWLRGNGYSVGEDLARVCRAYLQRGWRFVALRVLPTIRGQAMRYLSPVGIRLTTDRAVYPLAIASPGAPERTLVQLVVVAPVPVDCAESPSTLLPRHALLPAGRWYEQFRCTQGDGGLVKEAQALGALAFADMGHRADRWAEPAQYPWSRLWATRFTGQIAARDLTDLTFVGAADVRPFRVHIYQSAQVGAGPGTWLRTGLGRFLGGWVVVLLCGYALWATGWVAERRGSPQGKGRQQPPWRFVQRLGLYGGWLVLLSPAVLALHRSLDQLTGPRLYLSGQMSPSATAAWALALAIWAALALRLVAMEVRETGGVRPFLVLFTAASLPLLIFVPLSPSPQMRLAASLGEPPNIALAQAGALAAIVGFATVLAWLLLTVVNGPRRFRWMAGEFSALLLVFLAASPLFHGGGRDKSKVVSTSYRSAVAEARRSVAAFRYRQQAFPTTLSAATGPGGAAGLDGAGNPIVLKPTAAYRASRPLPADPLTGTTDWIYDPLIPQQVISLALRTRVGLSRFDAADAPSPESYWRVPSRARIAAVLGRTRSALWGAADTLVRADGSSASGPMLCAVDVGTMRAACISAQDASPLGISRLSAPNGGAVLALSAQITGRVPSQPGGDVGSGPNRPRTAIFTVTGPVLRVVPAGTPLAGRIAALEASPDGLRFACILTQELHSPFDRSLWLLDAAGMWIGQLADGVARVAWHPSGDYLVALLAAEQGGAVRSAPPPCRLVKIEPGQKHQAIGTYGRYGPSMLAVSYGRVFSVDADGALRGVELATGADEVYHEPSGEVLDLIHLGMGRVAALIASPVAAGTRRIAQLRILGSPGAEESHGLGESEGEGADEPLGGRLISPIASPQVRWTDGRIIGAYGSSGYHFVHLWSAEDQTGRVFMIGENGAPPQEIPVEADGQAPQ